MVNITPEFINKYKETLEQNLTLHVKYNSITLEKAGQMLSSIMENIFGSEQHAGIIHFIMHNDMGISPEDALSTAESHYSRGWRIRPDGNKYILTDEKYNRITDLSDAVSVIEPEGLEYTEEESYNFLREGDAKKLGGIAAKKGVPPADMVSPTKAYQLIERYYGNIHDLYPVVQSYKAIGKILRKTYYFEGGQDNTTLKMLREKGYIIDGSINPSSLPNAYLSGGGRPIIIRPVTQYTEVEEEYFKGHSTFLPFYKTVGIDMEVPNTISELGQIYGFYFYRDEDIQDVGEVSRIIDNIVSDAQSSKSERITSLIAAVMITENVVRRHNSGLESIRINSAKLSPVVKYLPRASKRKEEALVAALSEGKGAKNFTTALKGITEDEHTEEFKEAVGFFTKILPPGYATALDTLGNDIVISKLKEAAQ